MRHFLVGFCLDVVIDDSSRSNTSVFVFLACGMNECRRELSVLSMWLPYKRGKMTVQPISINLLYFMICVFYCFDIHVKACRTTYFHILSWESSNIICSSPQKHPSAFSLYLYFSILRATGVHINVFIKWKFIRLCNYLSKLRDFSFVFALHCEPHGCCFFQGN